MNTDEATRQMVQEWVDGYYSNRRSFQSRPLIPPTVFEDQELQKISIPVLFMVGENEKIYSAEQAVDRLHTVAPNIETAIIPKAGHDIWIVQAEAVNDHILGFLNKP